MSYEQLDFWESSLEEVKRREEDELKEVGSCSRWNMSASHRTMQEEKENYPA